MTAKAVIHDKPQLLWCKKQVSVSLQTPIQRSKPSLQTVVVDGRLHGHDEKMGDGATSGGNRNEGAT
jgi:hypothetical protein